MDKLDLIHDDILACSRCELREGCAAPVPGDGDSTARYLLIGEAPGKEEDETGVPFVGKSGKRLEQMLALAGISINDCYFSNTVRCRPPGNRDPKKKELMACRDYIWREIEAIDPEVIITVGRYALALFTDEGVKSLHGTRFNTTVNGKTYPVWAQYHPAAEFRNPRLRADILEDWSNPPVTVDHSYKITQKLPPKGTMIGLDTETDHHGGLGQWSIAWRDKKGQICVRPHYGPELDFPIEDYVVVGHNLKYDNRELVANGMRPPVKQHDTMIAAYCMGLGKQAPKDSAKSKSGSNMVGGLGLKYLARRQLGIVMKTWKEVKDHPEAIPEYNADDSVATLLLMETWLPQLPEHYHTIDMPLLPVIMAMEDRGIMIDPDFLESFAKSLDNQIAEFDDVVQHLAYHNDDLISYIYGTLEVEPWRFTDGGKPSVDADTLDIIDDPIVNDIQKYKGLFKDKGTYVDSYVNGRDSEGRIHCELKQTSTATGRLSCANPNLQNVDKEGGMRKLFVAAPGFKLVRFDYNQLEWRILAALTLDPILLAELGKGKKIHTITSEQMNVDYTTAKRGNFGIQYGAGAWKLAQTLDCSIDEAKDFMAKYFMKFPGVKKYQDEMREIALRDKAVTNYYGRTRRLDAMYAGDWRVRQEGIKEAFNTPIQGAGGEICKIAMIRLHEVCGAARMLLQVHDEILFEVPEREAVEFAHWLEEYVPTLTDINGQRFPVEAGVGSSWWECCKDENLVSKK